RHTDCESVPVEPGHDEARQDRHRSKNVKRWRENPTHSRQQKIEDLFGIERNELPIEKAFVVPPVTLDAEQLLLNGGRIQQPLVFKRLEEPFDRCERQRTAKLL